MALNRSGVRDTARVLHVSPSTVIRELKRIQIQPVVLKQLNPEQAEVEICLAVPTEAFDGLESELDEMWSYVTKNLIIVGYGMP